MPKTHKSCGAEGTVSFKCQHEILDGADGVYWVQGTRGDFMERLALEAYNCGHDSLRQENWIRHHAHVSDMWRRPGERKYGRVLDDKARWLTRILVR